MSKFLTHEEACTRIQLWCDTYKISLKKRNEMIDHKIHSECADEALEEFDKRFINNEIKPKNRR